MDPFDSTKQSPYRCVRLCIVSLGHSRREHSSTTLPRRLIYSNRGIFFLCSQRRAQLVEETGLAEKDTFAKLEVTGNACSYFQNAAQYLLCSQDFGPLLGCAE